MSKYPFGLRGDPFVPPATLSAKEASRLIRRRVRACNGDGGLLFPIEACDAIHSLARGVPDAVLALAGRALVVAAADGARAVAPAHVKQAHEAAIAVAPAEATPDRSAESRSAAKPRGVAATESHLVATPPRPELPLAPAIPSARPAEQRPDAQAPEAPDPHPAGDLIATFDELDDDLPPFRPASVALPMRPSEDLPEEAREWVSRFIPSQAPIAFDVDSDSPRALHVPAAPESPASVPVAIASRPIERVAEPAYAAASPRRAAHRQPGRRQSVSPTLLVVLGVVVVLAVVLRNSTPEHLGKPDSDGARSVSTTETPAPASLPGVTTASLHGQGPASSPASAAQPGTAPPSRLPAIEPSAQASDVRPEAANVEPVKHVPAPKFALEVATFIYEDRARQERDRLAATGLRARVVTTFEFGSRVYRVVIGSYPHPAAAERAADSLLSNGVVVQARVISAGSR